MQVDTVTIMQPYFVPYAGYFRLLLGADLFVLYDCVQFPRRGWVHRNRLPDRENELQWLTLPLAKAPQSVAIKDLAFRPNAAAMLSAEFARFPLLTRAAEDATGLQQALLALDTYPVDYIESLLALCAHRLGLPWRSIRSSSLQIPAELTGQDRILAITTAVGARRYVNAPGGRALYDPVRFAAAGVTLRFLSDYQGSYASILARLLEEPGDEIAAEIRANMRLVE